MYVHTVSGHSNLWICIRYTHINWFVFYQQLKYRLGFILPVKRGEKAGLRFHPCWKMSDTLPLLVFISLERKDDPLLTGSETSFTILMCLFCVSFNFSSDKSLFSVESIAFTWAFLLIFLGFLIFVWGGIPY